ncbi:MAG: hypothetical protein NC078_11735, partial [Ruminococcus sp.]|nr:hypothetical protein [Ruminococcus sp.]
MKNGKRTPKTLKGAVLIMVMTVMFVLIFLLAGTIAVVYSAHNRAMVKYEESQAYYTARSLLDAYLDAFLKDNKNVTGTAGTGITEKTYWYFNKDGDLDSVPAKQGRALELDIYSMKVSVAPKKASVKTDGTYNAKTNPYGGYNASDTNYPFDGIESHYNYFKDDGSMDMYLYDWVKQYILDLMLGDFSIPAGKTLEEFRKETRDGNVDGYKEARKLALIAINSQISDYSHTITGLTDSHDIGLNSDFKKYYEQFTYSEKDGDGKDTDTIYYRVPAGVFSNYGELTTGGSFGKVADTFPDGATDATIKIQLLERTMNLGTDGADYKLKFDNGNREKDHIKISVTVEVMHDGVPT